MAMAECQRIITKTKCPKNRSYVTIESTYRYVPDKNVYRFESATCSVNKGWSKIYKCAGTDEFNKPCRLINRSPYDLPPDSPDFLEENWGKRLLE